MVPPLIGTGLFWRRYTSDNLNNICNWDSLRVEIGVIRSVYNGLLKKLPKPFFGRKRWKILKFSTLTKEMRFLAWLAVAANSAQEIEQKCFECNVQRTDNSESNENLWNQCKSTGVERSCGHVDGVNQACFTKERMNNRGQVTMIQMGCKQLKACLNNRR